MKFADALQSEDEANIVDFDGSEGWEMVVVGATFNQLCNNLRDLRKWSC